MSIDFTIIKQSVLIEAINQYMDNNTTMESIAVSHPLKMVEVGAFDTFNKCGFVPYVVVVNPASAGLINLAISTASQDFVGTISIKQNCNTVTKQTDIATPLKDNANGRLDGNLKLAKNTSSFNIYYNNPDNRDGFLQGDGVLFNVYGNYQFFMSKSVGINDIHYGAYNDGAYVTDKSEDVKFNIFNTYRHFMGTIEG